MMEKSMNPVRLWTTWLGSLNHALCRGPAIMKWGRRAGFGKCLGRRVKGGSRLVEMLPNVGVFTKVSQELETEKGIFIPVRAFRMSLVLRALSVSGPRSTKPGGNLSVVQMPRKVQSSSRNGRDRYYRWKIRGGSPGSYVWLTRPRSCLEIFWGGRGSSTLDSTWGARRGTNGEIIVELEGNGTILDSTLIETMGWAVADDNVSVGVDFERYTGGCGGRGIGNDADCPSCVW